MKYFLFLLVFLLPAFLCGQTSDSLLVVQVDSLIERSESLEREGRYEDALIAIDAALDFTAKKLGTVSASYSDCLMVKADITRNSGNYPETEALLLEAKGIREARFGREHKAFVSVLRQLAVLYIETNEFDKAEQFALAVRDFREKTEGKESTSYASVLNTLARIYHGKGEYARAEPYYLECADIAKKTKGTQSLQYAAPMANLAVLYDLMGQFERSEKVYLEVIPILEQLWGRDHPQFAAFLGNVATIYWMMGKYEQAEPLFLEVLGTLERTVGTDHPTYGTNGSNLGALYFQMGNHAEAERILLRVKDIREQLLGKDHPEYAKVLNNLALVYNGLGKYDLAEVLFLEASEIKKRSLGEDHPVYALALDNLWEIYFNKGDARKAEATLQQALAIREKALGTDHPTYAGNLAKLGKLYLAGGQSQKALDYFVRAKTITAKALGKDHLFYADRLQELADAYLANGKTEEAAALYPEISRTHQQLMARAVHHLSERELAEYLHNFQGVWNGLLSLTFETEKTELAALCFDNSLFYKGFLLESANQLRQAARTSPETTDMHNRLKGFQRRLADQYALPVRERDSSLVARLEAEARDMEKELTREVAGFAQAGRQYNWQDVQKALKEGEAALEFVRFGVNRTNPRSGEHYAALLLRPGSTEPAFIPLCGESALAGLLAPSGDRKADYVNRLYAVPDRGAASLDQPEKSVHQLLWEPLEARLKDIHTIYFSPAGLLHRLNLSAIPVNDEETLADRYKLFELGSTRQLAATEPPATPNQQALLYGGVQFNVDSSLLTRPDSLEALLALRGERLAIRPEPNNRGGSWNYLKWTAREVDRIEGILSDAGLNTEILSGAAATEESFKSIGKGSASPRILHLATHGYFFADPEPEEEGTASVVQQSEHPMIRSGLLLAGGNYAWQHGKPARPDREDGILTAYEISQMDLRNTELVVLSACETGLGDINGNEGVYGLQRAFKIAGAKYLIMSLWQVPDRQTALLMENFYEKWLEDSLSIPEAFRQAQQELRELGFDPFQWAGFVLVE